MFAQDSLIFNEIKPYPNETLNVVYDPLQMQTDSFNSLDPIKEVWQDFNYQVVEEQMAPPLPLPPVKEPLTVVNFEDSTTATINETEPETEKKNNLLLIAAVGIGLYLLLK